MPKEWECPKCGFTHDAQGGYSSWKCSSCGAIRWPWMLWCAAGLAAVLLISGLWLLIPNENSDQKFLRQVGMFLQGDDKTEGEISQEEMDKLNILARRLGLSERTDELTKKGKLDYLAVRKDALRKRLNLPAGKEISLQDLQPLCELARRMNMVTAVQGCSVPIEEISDHLTQGEFSKARELLKTMPDDPQGKKLAVEMDTPLTVEVNLQYQKDGAKPSAVYPIDAPDLANLVLTNRDNYRIIVSVSLDKVFFYVFQKDHYGEIKRIFPDPVWSKGVVNPIHKGDAYQLPGLKEWFYLDEIQTDSIAESLYIIASPWQAKDIEQIYGKIYEATTPGLRKELIDKFLQQLQRRNNQTFKSIFYKEFMFIHGK